MGSRITTVSTREMAYPREAALRAIWEIKNIEVTEVKADAVEVDPETPTKGTYRVRGRFAGVPWRGEFAYELNEGGFHSRTAGVPPNQATVEGGFVVTPIAGGCTVIHYEQYVLDPSSGCTCVGACAGSSATSKRCCSVRSVPIGNSNTPASRRSPPIRGGLLRAS
jgi:hypothetical protein